MPNSSISTVVVVYTEFFGVRNADCIKDVRNFVGLHDIAKLVCGYFDQIWYEQRTLIGRHRSLASHARPFVWPLAADWLTEGACTI